MAVQLFLWKVLYWERGDTIFSDFLVLFSFHRICPWFWTNLLVLCLYSKPINCFATNWRWHTLFLLAVLNILCSNLLCGLSRTFFDFFLLWYALVSKNVPIKNSEKNAQKALQNENCALVNWISPKPLKYNNKYLSLGFCCCEETSWPQQLL